MEIKIQNAIILDRKVLEDRIRDAESNLMSITGELQKAFLKEPKDFNWIEVCNNEINSFKLEISIYKQLLSTSVPARTVVEEAFEVGFGAGEHANVPCDYKKEFLNNLIIEK